MIKKISTSQNRVRAAISEWLRGQAPPEFAEIFSTEILPPRLLADFGGLYLLVSPAMSKRWFCKYRKDGNEGRMSLGSYPDGG